MNRIFLFLLLFAASASANAIDFKRWFCDYCNLPTWSKPADAWIPPEALSFIKANNDAIVATGATIKWTQGDLITICDGSNCIPLKYVSGVWINDGLPYRDRGRGYKNASATLQSGSVGEIDSTYNLTQATFDFTLNPPAMRVWMVTAGPLTATDYGLRNDFSMGFYWGDAVSSSVFESSSLGTSATLVCVGRDLCTVINAY